MKSLHHELTTALTRLTRICETNSDNVAYLRLFFGKHGDSCLLPALAVAQETGDPIGQIIAEYLTNSTNDDLLLELYESLPANTISLREVHTVIAKRAAELAKAKHPDDWALIAETTGTYAAALADIGERSTALAHAFESACLYQRNGMDVLDTQFLQSLFGLSECLMHVGQMEDALLVQQEVTTGYRLLYETDPAGHIAQYANVLLVLSSYYKMQERISEAIDAGAKADYFIKQIANPSMEHIYLQHRILHNLVGCYEQIDQLDIATDLLRDNLIIIRDLSNHAKDRYGLEHIDTLETLAMLEGRLGNQEAAEAASTEALNELTKLYQYRPHAFASHYSNLLSNMGIVDLTIGKLDAAQQKMDQAVAILEPLFRQFPARFTTNLAATLNNRIEVYLALFRHDEAIRDAHRTLCLYRNLPGNTANVAMALNTLSNARMQSGDIFRAQRSITTCIRLYRRLTINDDVFHTDLAVTLGTLAAIYEQLENYPAALASADEALAYWDSSPAYLKEAHPPAYHQVAKVRLSSLIESEQYDIALNWADKIIVHAQQYAQIDGQRMADLLNLQSTLLNRIGRNAEAILAAQKAIALLEALPLDEVPAYKIDLADAWTNLGFLQASESTTQALHSANQAVKLYGELPEPLTLNMRTNQALALLNRGSMAHACGQADLAISSLQQALSWQWQIIEETEEGYDDLLLMLQTLCKAQFEADDPNFLQTAKRLREVLGNMDNTAEIAELSQQLAVMESNFVHRTGER